MLCKLVWIINMLKASNRNMPKTIIFCDTIYALTSVVNYLTMQLGEYAFYPNSSRRRKDCLIGIFHSMIQDKYKNRIFDSLKGNGIKRVVVATSTLSMGVNFPDVKYVIMYGPPGICWTFINKLEEMVCWHILCCFIMVSNLHMLKMR